jgi:hypothetical protein
VKLILSGFNAVAHRGQVAVDAIISSACWEQMKMQFGRSIKAPRKKLGKINKRRRLLGIFFDF